MYKPQGQENGKSSYRHILCFYDPRSGSRVRCGVTTEISRGNLIMTVLTFELTLRLRGVGIQARKDKGLDTDERLFLNKAAAISETVRKHLLKSSISIAVS